AGGGWCGPCAGLRWAITGVMLGCPLATAAGLLAYAGGLGWLARPFIFALRNKPPVHFATWSLLAGISWFAVLTVLLTIAAIDGRTWAQVYQSATDLTPGLAAGFAAQVLLGALSYLLPVSMGRGPAGTRAANTVFDRGSALRIVATNAGIAVFLLPSPSAVRVAVSVVVLTAFASFIPLVFMALRAARRARSA